MSSRQLYPNNRPATPFVRSSAPSLAPTSPSMYSQASLPRESWYPNMFPPQDLNVHAEHWSSSTAQRSTESRVSPLQNKQHRSTRNSSNRGLESRAPPIKPSRSSGDRNVPTPNQREPPSTPRKYATATSSAHTKPPRRLDRNGEDALMGGNNAISAPKRLSSKSAPGSGTHSRTRSEGRGGVVPVSLVPVSAHSTGTTDTIAPKRERVNFPTPENIPPRPPRSTVQIAPQTLPDHLVRSLQCRMPLAMDAQAAVSDARPTSGTPTSRVDSDLAAVPSPPFSEYIFPTGTAVPQNMRCVIPHCKLGDHGRPLPVAQGSGLASDTVIGRSAPMLQSQMEDGVPRWRKWEVRGPGAVDSFLERRRAASLTVHKRQRGTAGEARVKTPFHYSKSRSTSVKSLPARIEQSVNSLSNTSEKKRGLKSRFVSIFSWSPVSTPNLNESVRSADPSASTETVSRSLGRARTRTSSSFSFSLSKFALFSKRKQDSADEDTYSYVEITHPSIHSNPSEGERTPTSPRRPKSRWVSSDFEIDRREATMVARAMAL